MPLSGTVATEEPPPRRSQDHPAVEPEIDLETLAEKVYRLLKEDLQVERERLGRHRTW